MLHMHSQQRLGLAAAYFMSQQGAGERVGGAQGADICECKYLWGEKLGKKKSAGVLWQLCWPLVSSKVKDAGVLCEQSAGVYDKVFSDES